MKHLLFGWLGAVLLSGCYSHYDQGQGADLTICNFYGDNLDIYLDGNYIGGWPIDDESQISVDPGTHSIRSQDPDGNWIHWHDVELERDDSEMIILD